MTNDLRVLSRPMAATCLALCAATVAIAAGTPVSDRETRREADQSSGKPGAVIAAGCLKAADESGLPAEKTHDASGAPYFVLTNAQPVSPQSGGDAVQSGTFYRVIGISPRMLRARADTQVEITGKVESPKDRPAERAGNSLGGLKDVTAIDSLPAINAKSIKTLSPRCTEGDGSR